MRLPELARRLENLIRVGTIDSVEGQRCRVAIGDLLTTWLPWFALRAGADTDWWPPSEGEQVAVFSPGGDLGQGLVLTGLYTTTNPPPTANHSVREVSFSDGTVIRYDKASHHLEANIKGSAELRATGDIDAVAGGNITASAAGDIEAEAAGGISAAAPTVQVDAASITLNGAVQINGPLSLAGPLATLPGAGGAGGGTLQGDFAIEGSLSIQGGLTNNGTNVGSTHTHPGVQSGSSTTGTPQ